VASTLAIVCLWAILTNASIISPNSVPTPQTMIESFWEFFVSGYAGISPWETIGMSVGRAMGGLVIGLVIGIPLGLMMGYYAVVNAIFKPVVSFLRPIPALALIPLVVLFFGIGETAKVAVIAFAALLYGVLHSAAGASSVPENYLLLARSLGYSRGKIFFKVVFPSAAPFVFAGIRTATAIAWAVMVAAELIAASSGIGWMISDAANFYRLPFVYVGIILIGVVGLALETLLTLAETRLVHWTAKE
jgi:NitT/TauT family transport system permease protein